MTMLPTILLVYRIEIWREVLKGVRKKAIKDVVVRMSEYKNREGREMEIHQLTYLVEVAKLGSINKVAKKLDTKQSSVTRAIMQLEEQIGCMLIYRSNKGVELTNSGKEFVVYANEILSNYEKMKAICLDNGGKQYRKPLHISGDVAFFLGRYLKDFHEKYEAIQIHLKETCREQVIADVISGKCEIGLVTLTNWEEKVWDPIFKENGLIFHKIRRSRPHAYLGEKHPLYNQEVIEPNQLKGCPLICLEGRHELAIDFNMNGKSEYAFIKEQVLYLGDKHTVYEVIRETDAYVLAAWCDYVTYKGVKIIPVNVEGLYYEIGWLEKKRDKKRSDEQEIFIQQFEAYIRTRGEQQ